MALQLPVFLCLHINAWRFAIAIAWKDRQKLFVYFSSSVALGERDHNGNKALACFVLSPPYGFRC